MRKFMILAMLSGCFVAMAACEQDGPAERAGEKIDEATTDVANAIEDACEDVKEGAGAENTNC